MSESKRYATANNPTIQAVLSGMYRFASPQEAADQLQTLQRHFIVAKKQINNPEHPSLILWIKVFGLEAGDEKYGVLGHFAVVTYQKNDGRYALVANKMAVDYREHPQRAQVSRNNPNWGHPILRAVRKGKTYASIEAAQAELTTLHETFPKVSIPNPAKLFIMIYCSDRPAKERMVKHVLEIETNPQGQYVISCRENAHKPKAKTKGAATTAPASEETAAPQGSFTAKIALARTKKGKKPLFGAKKSDAE
jgi:hypothetical protein